MSELHVVLYQPEIPQNAGNVARTCAATDARLWLVRPLGFRLDDARLRRAGLDYWPGVQLEVVDDWRDLTQKLTPARFWYFSRHSERPFWEAGFRPGDALVFGSESAGLPDALRRETETSQWLRIPTTDKVRSLNVANCVAIAIYEVHRQWERRKEDF